MAIARQRGLGAAPRRPEAGLHPEEVSGLRQFCMHTSRREIIIMRKENQHKRTYKHHNLPHWDYPERLQYITYRLWDSLPKYQLKEILEKAAIVPKERRRSYMGHLVEEWVHNGSGCGILTADDVFPIILENWFYHHKKAYDILEWVIMPNHVHLLINQYYGYALKDVVESWKSFTSRRIMETASYKQAVANNPDFVDSVWYPNYFDRMIRGSNHKANTRQYILNNPVGLRWGQTTVQTPQDRPLSSATEQWKELVNFPPEG